MMPGLSVFEYQDRLFVISRCILPRSSSVQKFHMATSVSTLNTYPFNEHANFFQTEDDDPLTPEEIADLEESIQDLECGRAEVFPAEMSSEEVLARLDML